MTIDLLPDVLKPGIHCVRTHWIRGFMPFQLTWRTRTVRLMVPVCPESGYSEMCRAAAAHLWNLRAKAERAVPRPDGAVLDSLEDLTARTRAVARSLPEMGDVTGPGQGRVSFGWDYAAMLRILADLVRQLADRRSSLPRAALTAARDCQRHLERETAQLPDHSDARSAAQHLARLTSEIISEAAEHQAAPDDAAGHRDTCHHRGGGDDTAVRDLSG
jgi:hypothetical protein